MGPQHIPAPFFVTISVIMVMISRCCLPACTCGENGKTNEIAHFRCNALGGILNFLAFFAAARFHVQVEALLETIDPGGGGLCGSGLPCEPWLLMITMLFVTMVFRCQGCICSGLHQFGV